MRDLSDRQMAILKELALTDKPVYGSELARQFGKTQMTISGSIQTLANKKLVTDVPEPEERNKRLVRLTDKGAMFAVYYGELDYKAIVESHPYLEDLSNKHLRETWDNLSKYSVSDIFGKVLAEISVKNNLFNGIGSWLLNPKGKEFFRYKNWYRPIVTDMTIKFIERWQDQELTPSEFENRITWWIGFASANMFTPGEVIREIVQNIAI